MKTVLDKITESSYYSVQRYYIVVGLSCAFVLLMFGLSVSGATPTVSAVATDYPDGTSSTAPFTEESFRIHSLTVPGQSPDFKLTHGYQVESTSIGVIDSSRKQYHYSFTEPNSVLYTNETVKDREKTVERIYETDSETYKLAEDTTSQITLDQSILNNPAIKSVEMANNINHISWASTGVTEQDNTTYVTYKPTHINTNNIPKLETAEQVTGKLLINQETGLIKEYSVQIQGSSTVSSVDRIRASYFYTFEEAEPLEQPEWVN